MSTIGIHRIVNGVLTSADTATLAVTNQAGVTVVPTVVVPPSAPGVYSYVAPPLTPGNYTAIWTFTVAGSTEDVVRRIFQVESATAALDGISLSQIEQAIAARIGPYERMTVYAGSSPTGVVVRKLMSGITLGDYEDRYLLRRGLMQDGALIPNHLESDRARIVQEYLPTSGRLTPDLAWTNAPVEGETIELHYLEPEMLREVALQGLQRCFFWDTIQVSSTAHLTDLNITATAPWITRPAQIRTVQQGRYPYYMENVDWFEVYQQGGDVSIRMGAVALGMVRISALRPHASYVNGELSLTGPNHDTDILNIEREYAARAGHISAWMLATPKLTPIAAQGMAITMKQAADAFTISSMTYVKSESARIQNRFTGGALADLGQIGNVG